MLLDGKIGKSAKTKRRRQAGSLEDFVSKDERLFELAGRKSCFSGGGAPGRDHGFTVDTMKEAVKLRASIESTGEFKAAIREG